VTQCLYFNIVNKQYGPPGGLYPGKEKVMKVKELIKILNKVRDKEKIVNLIDIDFKAHDVAQIDESENVEYVDIHCNYEGDTDE
jgi:hypothetical protein